MFQLCQISIFSSRVIRQSYSICSHYNILEITVALQLDLLPRGSSDSSLILTIDAVWEMFACTHCDEDGICTGALPSLFVYSK